MLSDLKMLVNSTAVTRVNGYLGVYGLCDSLKAEIESFRLSFQGSSVMMCNLTNQSPKARRERQSSS
jgi:hypothetical protein